MKRAAAALALAALAVVATAIAAQPRVTMTTREARDPSDGRRLTFLVGTVAGAARGERISVLQKDCGPAGKAYRVADFTRTAGSGGWQYGPVAGPGYWRARWKRAASSPLLLPGQLELHTEVGKDFVRVRAETGLTGQSLRGRAVELQRRVGAATGARWVTVGRARLRRAVGPDWFEARVPVRIREATVRAYFPRATTSPCYLPAASAPWFATTRTAVTIRTSYGGPLGPRQLVLSGAVASRAAGERVGVSVKGCGPAGRLWRPIDFVDDLANVRTRAGGAWRYLSTQPRLTDGAWFRASWYPHESAPVLVRGVLPLTKRVRGRVVRVVVGTAVTQQRMSGRIVELQRRTGSRWLRVRQARFRRAGLDRYEARFRLEQRGLTLRAHVPAASAAPCYLPGTTLAWRS